MAVQPIEIGDAARGDAQPVVGGARKQLTFQYLVEAFDRALERGQRLLALRRQADVDEDVEAEADALGIEPCGIAGDDPRRLERADAAMARRGPKPDKFAQLGRRTRTAAWQHAAPPCVEPARTEKR